MRWQWLMSDPFLPPMLGGKILGTVAGTPGQQLMISKCLSRHIADEKVRIAEADGMLAERRDTVVAPSQAHSLICSRDSKPGQANSRNRCGRK